MNLMKAVGGISDRHIEEFAYVSRKKRRVPLWVKISSAACLTLFIAVAIVIVPVIKNRIGFYPVNGNSPRVYFNDRVYIYSGRTYTEEELSEMPGYPDHAMIEDGYFGLPDEYIEVGEITTTYYENEHVNGFGAGPKVGEKIYQDPKHPEDLYVYTMLFSNVEYRYLQFVDNTYMRLRVNGKTYVRVGAYDYDIKNLDDLPDGYIEAGEITTNDRKNRYIDGFGQSLDIGAKIYASSDKTDVVYVYMSRYDDHFAFVVYDE